MRALILGAAILAAVALAGVVVAKENGRRPCDRGAGGISYCLGDRFVCNNGKVSGSRETCRPEKHGTKPKGGK